MKSREMERLSIKYLLPHLPEYRAKGSLLYAEPVEHLLRGFVFESSEFDPTAFFVNVFVQPLYVPAESYVLDFGDRLGGGAKRWRPTAGQEGKVMGDVLGEIRRKGLPFLDQIRTPADLALVASTKAQKAPNNPRILEVEAYSLVLAGRYRDARTVLERIEQLARDLLRANLRAVWLEEVGTRARLLRETLARSPDEAIALLDQWRLETLTRLGLGGNRQGRR